MLIEKEIRILGKYIPTQKPNLIVDFLKTFSNKLNGLRNLKELERIYVTKTNLSNFSSIFSLVTLIMEMEGSLDVKGKKDEFISSSIQTQKDAFILVKRKKALKKKNIPLVSNLNLENEH